MKRIIEIIAIVLVLSGCTPSTEAIQAAIAKTQTAMPTQVAIIAPTMDTTLEYKQQMLGIINLINTDMHELATLRSQQQERVSLLVNPDWKNRVLNLMDRVNDQFSVISSTVPPSKYKGVQDYLLMASEEYSYYNTLYKQELIVKPSNSQQNGNLGFFTKEEAAAGVAKALAQDPIYHFNNCLDYLDKANEMMSQK
jgi:hypothetical protein